MRELTLEEMAMVTGGMDEITVTAPKKKPVTASDTFFMPGNSGGLSAQDLANLGGTGNSIGIDQVTDEIVVHAQKQSNQGSFICVNGALFFAGGICYDSNGHLYGAAGIGTPDLSVSFGASNNLNGVLTGLSASFSSESVLMSVAPGNPGTGSSTATAAGVSVGVKPGAAVSVTLGWPIF
jgi:hypothetical protein